MPLGSARSGQKTSPRGNGAHPPRSDEETTAPQRDAYDCVVSCAAVTAGAISARAMGMRRLMSTLSSSLEVYEPTVWVSSHQLHAHAVADIEPFVLPNDHSFRGRADRSNERALLIRPRDDRIEGLANASAQRRPRCGLPYTTH